MFKVTIEMLMLTNSLGVLSTLNGRTGKSKWQLKVALSATFFEIGNKSWEILASNLWTFLTCSQFMFKVFCAIQVLSLNWLIFFGGFLRKVYFLNKSWSFRPARTRHRFNANGPYNYHVSTRRQFHQACGSKGKAQAWHKVCHSIT